MVEQVPDGDALLAAAEELGDELADRVIEAESVLFPKPSDGQSGDRLGGREPEQDAVGAHGQSEPRLAKRTINHKGATKGDVKLGTRVKTISDAAIDNRHCPGQRVWQVLHRFRATGPARSPAALNA